MLLFTHKNTAIPPNTERNELIAHLRDSGSSLEEIANHPRIIELSDNKILTLGRVSQIYRKTKGGDKDGN